MERETENMLVWVRWWLLFQSMLFALGIIVLWIMTSHSFQQEALFWTLVGSGIIAFSVGGGWALDSF